MTDIQRNNAIKIIKQLGACKGVDCDECPLLDIDCWTEQEDSAICSACGSDPYVVGLLLDKLLQG